MIIDPLSSLKHQQKSNVKFPRKLGFPLCSEETCHVCRGEIMTASQKGNHSPIISFA